MREPDWIPALHEHWDKPSAKTLRRVIRLYKRAQRALEIPSAERSVRQHNDADRIQRVASWLRAHNVRVL